jgi:hypothetical protein
LGAEYRINRNTYKVVDVTPEYVTIELLGNGYQFHTAPDWQSVANGMRWVESEWVRQSRLSAYNNPLSGWDRRYEGSVGSGDYYYGPMLKADAEEKFRASLAVSDRVLTAKGKLPLPLSLIIRPGVPPRPQEHSANSAFASTLAAQTQSVGLLEYVYGRTGDRAPKPGDSNRETPHTLFNCLHRLCEFISQPGEERDGKLWVNPVGIGRGDIAFLPCLPPVMQDNFGTAVQMVMRCAEKIDEHMGPKGRRHAEISRSVMQYMQALLSSGLNTASGRLGAIADPEQALAEAFAKFCLSTDDVYNPNTPLMMDGKPIVFDDYGPGYTLNMMVQNTRRIWGVILEGTADSIVTVFGQFVKAYYSKVGPLESVLSWRGSIAGYASHSPLEHSHDNAFMKSLNLTDNAGQPLEFKAARSLEEAHYASELYKAVSALFERPSRDAEHAAGRVVAEALNSLMNFEQWKVLRDSAPPGSDPEYRFLREKYAKPRNTPASIAKAKRVNAALDVLEARNKPRPGLYSVFIQPQE